MPSPQPVLLSAVPQHSALLLGHELRAGFKLPGIRTAVVLYPCGTLGTNPAVLQ